MSSESVSLQTAKSAVAPDATSDSNSSGSNVAAAPAEGVMRAGAAPAQAPAPSNAKPASPVAKQLIVTTAAMSVRVADVRAAVEKVRNVAAQTGAQIENLTYEAGGPEGSGVQPADGSQGSSVVGGSPPSAQITLRVPAAQLEQAERAASALGQVTEQTSAQSDVTAQHVDMAARLRNLRAEEARLRALFSKAGDVSDLLEVEQELSSVRGDIESAQAQLAYLDQQVALSTLAISLSQPGPIVRPAFGASWGIADAVTQGVQSAVALVRALIVGCITLAPLAALILLAWGIVRVVRRVRSRRIPADADTIENLPSAD